MLLVFGHLQRRVFSMEDGQAVQLGLDDEFTLLRVERIDPKGLIPAAVGVRA